MDDLADNASERSAEIRVERGALADLDAIAELFQGYLDFYDAPGDRSDARAFLNDRMTRGESLILLARVGTMEAGFTQVFPTFSSVRRAPVWILNDLYIRPEHRRSGVARALIRAVVDEARHAGAVRVELSTDETNTSAQALYDAEAFVTGLPVRHYIKRVH